MRIRPIDVKGWSCFEYLCFTSHTETLTLPLHLEPHLLLELSTWGTGMLCLDRISLSGCPPCLVRANPSHSHAQTHPVFQALWLTLADPLGPKRDALHEMPDSVLCPQDELRVLTPLCPDHPQFSLIQLFLKVMWLLSLWTTWWLRLMDKAEPALPLTI